MQSARRVSRETSMRLFAVMPPLLAALAATFAAPADDPPPKTGPATEKRFPPLQLPPGFKATLFACDPFIEYPSVIAAGPKANQLFVAIDYVTGLGVEIVRRDEIRIIEDTDGDGYADKATVVAAGFNSIQGLAYHDGAVYVMHAPFLTVLRDTDGDGKADQRKDLLDGLGLKPEDNPSRLHCANGGVVGHDGWLYLALGDNGCNVLRPEGDRLIFNGGGILRCRPDGRDLHIFATGLRNIYDIALDEELNVFVRDNENDGGDYMIRVCHSFFGADHGYPHLYYERPDEALPPLADMGRGSSAGVVCYLETAFPKEFRGNLFGCEWGKSLVRYELNRSGSGFAPAKEFEFAAGAAKDPYGFKPTDVVVMRDGSLMVSDWCDGQRPKRGRGRIYRIVSTGDGARNLASPIQDKSLSALIVDLDSASHCLRSESHTTLLKQRGNAVRAVQETFRNKGASACARMHAIWLIANAYVSVDAAIPELQRIMRNDPESRVRAQAVRAIADLSDPILVKHRLDAGRGDAKLAQTLTALPNDPNPRVQLEIVIALGRLRWAEAPRWLAAYLTKPDATLAHAAQQNLRRCDNWPAVLKLLDLPDTAPMRAIALRAVADQHDPVVVDGLIERLGKEKDATRRRQYADALTRVYKKPGPWKYWGYRPGPRPANTVAWERTEAIEKALDMTLADPEHSVRFAALQRMQRARIPIRFAAVAKWLSEDMDEKRVAEILKQMRDHQPIGEPVEALSKVVLNPKHAIVNRRTALNMLIGRLEDSREQAMLNFARVLEDGPVLADALRNVPPFSKGKSVFLAKLTSTDNEVRAAAIFQLGHLKAVELTPQVPKLLTDADARVRVAAAHAAGFLRLQSVVDMLLKLVEDADASVRQASLEALHDLAERRAAPLAAAALKDPLTRMSALHCLAKVGGPEHAKTIADVARNNPSADILPLAISALSRLNDRAMAGGRRTIELSIAELQGSTGVLARWHVRGPLTGAAIDPLVRQWAVRPSEIGLTPAQSEVVLGIGAEAAIIAHADPRAPASAWLGVSEFVVHEATAVQFLGACRSPWRIWLDDRLIFESTKSRPFVPDADRFEAKLDPGAHRLVVHVASAADNKESGAEFHLRFRRRYAAANHEALIQAALAKPGNAERGKKLFLDVAKTQCLKCHRLGEQGEKIGPDLTGVGNRFARVYLIESILEPNRTIAPSYETLQVEMKDGRLIAGVRINETAEALTIGDAKGDKHVLPRAKYDTMRPLPTSTMPEGLERSLSPDDFVDLIAFLTSQK